MSEAFERLKEREKAFMCRTYSRYPLGIVRGKGSRLWDVDGKEYVESNDFPKQLESEEFLPMMFASEETPLSRMIFSKVDAVLDTLRDDQDLRKIALLEQE